MTNEERIDYMRKLEQRVRELEVELNESAEELKLEKEVTEGLHREIESYQRRLRAVHRLDITRVARAVHDLLYREGIAPGDIPWQCASSAWRAQLFSVLEPFAVDID